MIMNHRYFSLCFVLTALLTLCSCGGDGHFTSSTTIHDFEYDGKGVFGRIPMLCAMSIEQKLEKGEQEHIPYGPAAALEDDEKLYETPVPIESQIGINIKEARFETRTFSTNKYNIFYYLSLELDVPSGQRGQAYLIGVDKNDKQVFSSQFHYNSTSSSSAADFKFLGDNYGALDKVDRDFRRLYLYDKIVKFIIVDEAKAKEMEASADEQWNYHSHEV